MFHNELHLRIDDVASRVMSRGDVDFDELDAHASRGCSICARALVNAQDRTVDVAVGAAVAPRRALRERVLAAALAHAATPRPGAPPTAVRVPDPSAAVAHLHIGAPGDAERVAFIDRVAAIEPRDGDAASRLLAEIERLTGFPLLFVSIVRGERVSYRVQRGLGGPLVAFRDMRREITYCTHCVASGLPLVVPDAGREPFFRASKMVMRYGIQAYAGVPLRASDGTVFGTICALDFAPRQIKPSIVRLLQLYAEPIAAEVEDGGATTSPGSRSVERDRVEPLGGGRFAHRFGWFERLLDLEVERVREDGTSSALLTVDGPRARGLADAANEGEPMGRVGSSALGLLLRGASLTDAAARAGESTGRFGGLEVRFAMRILLVESRDSIRHMIETLVQASGHEVRSVASGDDAVEVALKERFDVVLLDLMLPGGVDGFGVVKHLRANEATKKTPVFVLSAMDDAETQAARPRRRRHRRFYAQALPSARAPEPHQARPYIVMELLEERVAPAGARSPGASAGGQRGADGAAGGERARRGTRQGHSAPRHQAREHPPRRGRARRPRPEDRRLRHRQAATRRRREPQADAGRQRGQELAPITCRRSRPADAPTSTSGATSGRCAS